MMQEANHDQTVIIVDDDDAVREALSWLLEDNGFAIRAFDSGESLLAASHCVSTAGCLVLDVRLSGISGLIRPDGSVAFQLPEFTNASGVAEVPLRDCAKHLVLVKDARHVLALLAFTAVLMTAAILRFRKRLD